MEIEHRMDLAVKRIEGLKDEHAQLKERVEWLEGKMEELLNGLNVLVSLGLAAVAYYIASDSLGGLIGFGAAVGVFLLSAWYGHRQAFRGYWQNAV
jgi:hypothetical protein